MDRLSKIIDYLLELAFFALIVRSVLYGASVGEAISITAIVASIAFDQYLNKSKIDSVDQINKKIEDLASQVQSIRLDKSLRRQVSESQNQASSSKRIF